MCSEKKVKKILAIERPDLVKEWNYNKNGNLSPNNITISSNQKIWWNCSKNKEHEWIRNKGVGCPYCAGKKVCNENNFAILFPDIAKEWHPTKNGNLNACDVTAFSSKKRWWMCTKNHEHIWESSVANRSKGSGCPYCSGLMTTKEECLASISPHLIKEWHITKNKDKTPYNMSARSGKKAWWICEKGHEYDAHICNRTNGSGCPYCAGKKVCNDNSFAILFPELAKEWNYNKNGELSPFDITFGSSKKVWWKCEKGHEWSAVISNRTKDNGTGCPQCNKRQTSFPEQAIYFYIKKIFPKAENRLIITKSRHELDIFIPDFNLGIEYDGAYSHLDVDKDKRKDSIIKNKGINLIRIREKGLPIYDSAHVIFYERLGIDYESLGLSIKFIFETITHKFNLEDKVLQEINQLIINLVKDEAEIYKNMHEEELERSLLIKNPFLAKEWNPTKNGDLKPEHFPINSNAKVWWICKKNHEWQAKINDRSRNSNCPYCSNKNVYVDNCLATLKPNIAQEWHPVKNGELTPSNIYANSKKSIWWKCKLGHEWEEQTHKRTNDSECPQCKLQRNSLATNFPQLISEWHTSKNGHLTPNDVTPGSHKKVWWICNKEHEWKADISNRANGSSCPYCAGRKVCKDNSLKTLNPNLSSEWHDIKNGNLTPNDVTPGSKKKVWWKCQEGHEWQAVIYSRHYGNGCSACSRTNR